MTRSQYMDCIAYMYRCNAQKKLGRKLSVLARKCIHKCQVWALAKLMFGTVCIIRVDLEMM